MAPLDGTPSACSFWKQVDFEPCETMDEIENKACLTCELCLKFQADVKAPVFTVSDSQEEAAATAAAADPYGGRSAEPSSSSSGANTHPLPLVDSYPVPETQVPDTSVHGLLAPETVPETQAYPEESTKRQKT